MPQSPSVGRIVHYVSYGTPGGEYTSQCRAAIITSATPVDPVPGEVRLIEDGFDVGLCVLNPEGQFFNQHVPYHDGAETPGDPGCDGLHADGPHRYCPCGWSEAAHKGGTWHWPEIV